MKHVTLLALLLIITGCASVGREVKSDQLAGFAKGKTTINDVKASLGQPTMTTITSDGKRQINYTFAHSQARPESFIPIVGLFVGGADVRSSAVNFTFDKDGLLEDYTQSESNQSVGTGFGGGEYRAPDRSLPQEQPK